MHPRYGTPANALIFQSAITSALLVFVGRFQALFSIAIVSEWLAYGLAASTIFVFRKRERVEPRSFRVPGYPVVPLIFIASAAVLVIFSVKDRPADTLAGAAVILCGIPARLLYRRYSVGRYIPVVCLGERPIAATDLLAESFRTLTIASNQVSPPDMARVAPGANQRKDAEVRSENQVRQRSRRWRAGYVLSQFRRTEKRRRGTAFLPGLQVFTSRPRLVAGLSSSSCRRRRSLRRHR